MHLSPSSHGLVGHRTKGNAADYSKPTVIVYYNVDYVRDPKGTNYVRNRILKVAKKLSDEKIHVRFAVSNADEFRQELTQYGIPNVKKGAKYVLASGPKDEKYHMSNEFRFDLVCVDASLRLTDSGFAFSYEALEDFARQVVKGSIEPYLKSQAVPDQTGDVKIVVAKNFDAIVNDKSKDALIEFYAPW